MSPNVFTLKDFLNPRSTVTPLIELPEYLNPLAKHRVRIFAKRMDMLPLGNIKSLPAFAMLRAVNLDAVHTLVENSSGNTVASLAILGRLFGVPHTKALVSNEVSSGKLALLRLFGVEVIVKDEPICPDPNDPESGIYLAKAMGLTDGWLNPSQYDNETNPAAHYASTGPQIWQQLDGTLTVFCAGLGTTGTLVGTGSYLKEQSASVVTVGVVRSPNNPVPGVRTENLLREIAFDWREVADAVELVGTRDAYLQSLKLCREGLLVGPSSGFALAGLLQFLFGKYESGELDTLRNRNGEVVAVFICCDSPLSYLQEYFEYLGEEYFLPIQNAELLKDRPTAPYPTGGQSPFAIQASAAYPLLYSESVDTLWERVRNGEEVSPREGLVLLDVRRPDEYEDAHLPGATHIQMQDILSQPETVAARLCGKKVYTICRSGNRSGRVTEELRQYAVNIWNLQGGMIEWSEKNLPRVRPSHCLL